MRRASFEDLNCSIAQCLEVVGDWWSLLVVRESLFGITRFEDFAARLGIARNTLTHRLDHLVGHGVLERVAYQERPVRYEYRLTEKGLDLWTVVTAMRQWGDRWAAADGPPVDVVHVDCGHVTTAVPSCSRCGEVLRPQDLRAQPGPGALGPDVLPAAPTG
jgi:DNA-binding HxlR family transcriptional regulator